MRPPTDLVEELVGETLTELSVREEEEVLESSEVSADVQVYVEVAQYALVDNLHSVNYTRTTIHINKETQILAHNAILYSVHDLTCQKTVHSQGCSDLFL